MRFLLLIHSTLLLALAVAAGIVLIAILGLIVVDVLVRTAGSSPPSFTITYVEYLLLYFTMFATPYLVHVKKHVVIESFVGLLPARISRVVEKIVCTACFTASLIVFAVAVELLSEAWMSGELDTRGIDIPLWILYLPMPPCFFLLCIEFLRFMFGADTMFQRGSPQGEM